MTLVLGIFGASIALELLLVGRQTAWRMRTVLSILVTGVLTCSSVALLLLCPNIATGLLVVTSAYRVFNLLRIVEARIDAKYLRPVTRRTSLWLISWQVVISVIWWIGQRFSVAIHVWLWILIGVQLITAVLLVFSTRRSIRTTTPVLNAKAYADRELPSITVAVPARNEDEQLETCLRSILASDYPKLEVLVYDDCSMDKTAEIIRSFAHDGVRFIQGAEPSDSWLAKNKAYDQLAEAASGEIILFCGVDVRFEPDSIRELIALMLTKHKSMLSLLPLNVQPGLSLVQSMRYYWEFALPRRTFNRPPVLSACWLITAEQLKNSGGFAAVRRSITPEAHFARDAIRHDGYSFMRSSFALGVTSDKPLAEQRNTAERTRYPALHRRPEVVLAVSLAELLLLLAPFAFLLVGLRDVFGWPIELCLLVDCMLLAVTYVDMVRTMFREGHTQALVIFPVAVALDIAMLHYSMWKYEFSEVEWRGRNVCIPVMRVDEHLPKL